MPKIEKTLLMVGSISLEAEIIQDPPEEYGTGKFHGTITYQGKTCMAEGYGRNDVLNNLGRQVRKLMSMIERNAKDLRKLNDWNESLRS